MARKSHFQEDVVRNESGANLSNIRADLPLFAASFRMNQ
jgi:hypothetical protein